MGNLGQYISHYMGFRRYLMGIDAGNCTLTPVLGAMPAVRPERSKNAERDKAASFANAAIFHSHLGCVCIARIALLAIIAPCDLGDGLLSILLESRVLLPEPLH